MASELGKTVYWDACVWIAYADETPESKTDAYATESKQRCMDVMHSAKANDLIILTSQISIVEASSLPADESSRFEGMPAVFQLDYVALVPVNRAVLKLARNLVLSKYRKLKPYDAVHLSSAITSKASEFHTFDKDLLRLDGKIDEGNGSFLKICLPQGGEFTGYSDNCGQVA